MKAKIAGLALLTSALFSTQAFAAKEYIAWCSNGNFLGQVAYNKIVTNDATFFKVYNYKITRKNGQKGGNKANINISASAIMNNGSRAGKTYRSPDNRKQDNQWRSMDAQFAIAGRPQNIRSFTLDVEFVFDKKGKDPKCKINTDSLGGAYSS